MCVLGNKTNIKHISYGIWRESSMTMIDILYSKKFGEFLEILQTPISDEWNICISIHFSGRRVLLERAQSISIMSEDWNINRMYGDFNCYYIRYETCAILIELTSLNCEYF